MKTWISISRYFLPAAALTLLIFAFGYAFRSQRTVTIKPPPITPASSPFGQVVAGTGFVEPSTESSTQAMISVGSQLSGVVVSVAVKVDQKVTQGELLFSLDNRSADAERMVREAAVTAAEAQLRKLELQPRPEEVPPLEAQVMAYTATLATATDVQGRK